MEYAEKFKDPRWQKLRLKILERDEWTCQNCRDTESTLHIHHRYYIEGKEPWEYPDESLITLCEECHEIEKIARPAAEESLLQAFREKFLWNEVETFAIAFHWMVFQRHPMIMVDVFKWFMNTPEIQKDLLKQFVIYNKQKISKAKGRKIRRK